MMLCAELTISIAFFSFGLGSALDTKRIEICLWETHSLNCSDESQIIIISAIYGQMAENICNNTKTDSAQCSGLIDVRSLLKARCEQRMSCIIELPDKDLDAMTPNCSKSAIPHLVIVYQCKIVHSCPPFIPPDGAITKETEFGILISCPSNETLVWKVRCVRGTWTPRLRKKCKPAGEIRPVCQSTIETNGLVGQNSCNIEPDEVHMICSIDLYDDIPIQIEWREAGLNYPVAVGVSDNETSFVQLSMKADITMNGSYYICNTSTATYCTSDVFKILYAFSSDYIVKRNVNDEIVCQANSSQKCTYKWKHIDADTISQVSTDQVLVPKTQGLFKCEADCSIRANDCTVVAMMVQVYSTEFSLLLSVGVVFGTHVGKSRKISKCQEISGRQTIMKK